MERMAKIRRIDSKETGGASGDVVGIRILSPSWRLLRRLPYHLRLYVLLFLARCAIFADFTPLYPSPFNPHPFDSLEFRLKGDKKPTDEEPTNDDVLGSDGFPCRLYIQSLFGYFVEDFTRKVFLIVKTFTFGAWFHGFQSSPYDPFHMLRLSVSRRRWCPLKPLCRVSLSSYLRPKDNPTIVQTVDKFFTLHNVEGLIEPPIQTESFEFGSDKYSEADNDTYYSTDVSSIESTLNRRFLRLANLQVRSSFSPLIDFLLFRCPNLRVLSLCDYPSIQYDGKLTQIASVVREGDDLPIEVLTSPARLIDVRFGDCSLGNHFLERFVEVTNPGESLKSLPIYDDCQGIHASLKEFIGLLSHYLSSLSIGLSMSKTADLFVHKGCLDEVYPLVRILHISSVAEECYDQFLSNLIHLFPNLELLDFESTTDRFEDHPEITLSRVQQLSSFGRLKGLCFFAFGYHSLPSDSEEFVSVLRCLGELNLLRLRFDVDSEQKLNDLIVHFANFFGSTLRTLDLACWACEQDVDSLGSSLRRRLKQFIRIGVSFLSDFRLLVVEEIVEEICTFGTLIGKPESLTRFCLNDELLYHQTWEEGK